MAEATPAPLYGILLEDHRILAVHRWTACKDNPGSFTPHFIYVADVYITWAAAGYILGENGDSVCDIVALTGADVSSRQGTWQAENVPARWFQVRSADRTEMERAVAIMERAVQQFNHYVVLKRNFVCIKSKNFLASIDGVSFQFRPPSKKGVATRFRPVCRLPVEGSPILLDVHQRPRGSSYNLTHGPAPQIPRMSFEPSYRQQVQMPYIPHGNPHEAFYGLLNGSYGPLPGPLPGQLHGPFHGPSTHIPYVPYVPYVPPVRMPGVNYICPSLPFMSIQPRMFREEEVEALYMDKANAVQEKMLHVATGEEVARQLSGGVAELYSTQGEGFSILSKMENVSVSQDSDVADASPQDAGNLSHKMELKKKPKSKAFRRWQKSPSYVKSPSPSTHTQSPHGTGTKSIMTPENSASPCIMTPENSASPLSLSNTPPFMNKDEACDLLAASAASHLSQNIKFPLTNFKTQRSKSQTKRSEEKRAIKSSPGMPLMSRDMNKIAASDRTVVSSWQSPLKMCRKSSKDGNSPSLTKSVPESRMQENETIMIGSLNIPLTPSTDVPLKTIF